MMNLTGYTALVAGGGRGYGLRAAQALADAGASIAIADINPDRAETAAQTVGGTALGIQGDVSNKFQASHLIEATREQFDTLDIVIINAHVSPADPILKMDEWNWRRSLEVNVTGTFFMGQLAARVMVDERGGHLVFLVRGDEAASVAVKTAEGAVRSLAEGMRTELTDTNVHVHLLDLQATENFEEALIGLFS